MGRGMQGPLFSQMAALLLVLHTGSKAVRGDVTHETSRQAGLCKEGQW